MKKKPIKINHQSWTAEDKPRIWGKFFPKQSSRPAMKVQLKGAPTKDVEKALLFRMETE